MEDLNQQKHSEVIAKMSRFVRGEDPPESIPSDGPSEYMRGYSDGLAQAEETIAAAIQRAKADEREACAGACDDLAKLRVVSLHDANQCVQAIRARNYK